MMFECRLAFALSQTRRIIGHICLENLASSGHDKSEAEFTRLVFAPDYHDTESRQTSEIT